MAAGYLNRVNDIWLENEENVENGLKKCSLEGRIDIKDLSFSYSKDSAPVIENLNLTIEPGQRIALVGQSGSGKSTLSKILSGLYKIDTGKILFDGVNINQIDKKILSQNLGVVPQDSFLLNRSILDNITLKNEVTSQKIEEVCKAVQIYDEIMAMPMKFNTIISEMGRNIGQAGKILADSGYQGLMKIYPQAQTPRKSSKLKPLTVEDKAYNHALSKERSKVENIFAKVKTFKMFSTTYRNHRKRFGLRMNLSAGIINHELGF
ncbi:ATP-binding cassette domain-containing protein [Streptococcus pneumoniae]|uniref:ATP-binding cassette domain-containing protein n=1 Tax=Streptococcus pneumoniae TaxID=1313 RepID=UPI001F2A5973|nr:ATP-binding cassette domain-containing protein [Streptococcus pneumoniae]